MKLWGKDIPSNSREVSLLAIVETVAASALALWIAFGLGHLKWLALYVCLAPLLLLRTRYSTRLGLDLFCRLWRYPAPLFDKFIALESRLISRLKDRVIMIGVWRLGFSLPMIGLLAYPTMLLGLIAKVSATFVGCVWIPHIAFLTLPRNWFKQALQIDSTCWPELMPGLNQASQKPQMSTKLGPLALLSSHYARQFVLGDGSRFRQVVNGVILLNFAALPLLISLFYRWCLKATALVYLPLVFSFRSIFTKGDTLRARLGDLLDTQLSKVQRIYTGFVIVFTGVIPFALASHYSALCTALAQQFPAGEPVLRYWLVFDMQLKMWHVAGLLGAALTWGLYLKADQLRVKMQNGMLAEQREQKQALRGLQALMVARAVFSAYTIFCGVVAFAKTQSWITLNVVWVP